MPVTALNSFTWASRGYLTEGQRGRFELYQAWKESAAHELESGWPRKDTTARLVEAYRWRATWTR